ncbi:MAG: type I pullulanase [Clostridia bacterium]|nr:type I pullulanase [Clostridia bacterium]
MRKKFFSALLSVLIVFAFALSACTEVPETPDNPNHGNPSQTEELPDIPDGERQLVIYYNRSSGYENCDIWLWYGTVTGKGYTFTECKYGARVVWNLPADVEEVGFIIRTGCSDPGGSEWGTATKDGTGDDRFIALEGDRTIIYTKAGDPKAYSSDDGGETLTAIVKINVADLLDLKRISVRLSESSIKLTKDDVVLTDADGKTVEITKVDSNIINLPSEIDITKKYTLTVTGFAPVTVMPLTYMSSKAFDNAYAYDGELGVELKADSTTFRLWAPTASKVTLNLYDAGTGEEGKTSQPLVKGEKGLWSLTVDENLDGKYYTYTVDTMLGSNEVVDPYARSAGLNGQRGMILDLERTNPTGWTKTPFDNPAVENYTDAEIWEVHIRDFSNNITNSQYKGKYLAFTETGLKNGSGLPVGVDYLKELGVTHVHLLPSFDYASVDESKNTQFNWGYDPQNYNVPEGSYSTDPTDGAVRVNEYKQMVQALHNQGISVVMDVVYNHTYVGDSNFQYIVPYYYYRYKTTMGVNSNGSGCGNETASERAMMRKFMVDSVTYWQKEYNLDGFRFDLMGLHDKTTMQEIEKSVHAYNPEAIIYGEGWTADDSTLGKSNQSTLAQLESLNKNTSTKGVNGIAMFNDVIRDGIKGSVFDIEDTGFVTGAKSTLIDKILFGVKGSVEDSDFGGDADWYAPNPTAVVNYVSAHDNYTLWDRICYVYGEEEDALELNLLRNKLSAAIIQTSLGIPFMQAGEEMLRSKKREDGTFDSNSYSSPDSVNNLKWDALEVGSDEYKTMQYYKGLIAFRKSCPILRSVSAFDDDGTLILSVVETTGALVAFTVKDPESGEVLLIVYNAETEDQQFTLPDGNWNLYIDGDRAGTEVLESNCSGEVTLSKISCYVYKAA